MQLFGPFLMHNLMHHRKRIVVSLVEVTGFELDGGAGDKLRTDSDDKLMSPFFLPSCVSVTACGAFDTGGFGGCYRVECKG